MASGKVPILFGGRVGMSGKRTAWVALALLTSGCLGQADSKKADDATARFYQELAARRYQAIYDEAAPDLRNTTSAADFIDFMQRIDAAMGACQPPVKRFDWHTNATTSGFFLNQGYNRTCAKGAIVENVTIVVRDGAAKLAGYQMESHTLNPS
jgi:hypothetical protein